MPISNENHVNGRQLKAPYSSDDSKLAHIHMGIGCFWGAERKFWDIPGVLTTAVGYGGGFTPNPSYEEVCSGRIGHNELVLVVYEPNILINKYVVCYFLRISQTNSGHAAR